MVRIVAPPESLRSTENFERGEISSYVRINDISRIARASWHQGSEIFLSRYRGIQCCAMAVASII